MSDTPVDAASAPSGGVARDARADPSAWLALARAAEVAGDLPLAFAHYLEAVRRDARHARALVGVGLALYRTGQVAVATEAFLRATEAQPGLAEAWGNLAAMLGETGRLPDALAALDRALALTPDLAALHALKGDLMRLGGQTGDAAVAYACAARLRPDVPEFLNKLSSIQRLARNAASAEASLCRALAVAPAFGLARVNLGTLYVEQLRLDEGRALLRQALAAPDLDPDARREATVTLSMLDEHERLAPVIAEAIAQMSDAPILRSISMVHDTSLPFDERLLATLAEIAQKAAAATDTPRFARRERAWPGWAAVEAHFALHLGDDPEAVLQTASWLASPSDKSSGDTASKSRRDLHRHTRAIVGRQAAALPEGGAAWESRVRFWHAMLAWENPEFFPGQFKPTPNLFGANPLVTRVRPESVAGTFRRFFTGDYHTAPPGPWRAALVNFAIVAIHGFADGNGRLARFAANLELENAGFHPIVLTDRASKTVAAALTGVRTLADLQPLVELFARASTETATLVERLCNHGKSPH